MVSGAVVCAGHRVAFTDQSDGPPVLVLHGFTGSRSAMGAVVAALMPTHRVIAPDLIGHGESAAPSDVDAYSAHATVAQLEALLDHLDLPLVDVVGYSLGGRLALTLATANPGRIGRLVLLGSSAGIEDEAERADRRAADEALARFIEADGVQAFVDRWEQIPLFATQLALSAEIRDGIRRTRLRNSPAGLANSLRGIGPGSMPSLWDRLSAMQHPTLLVAGAHDSKYLAIGQRLADAMPHAERYIVPGVGHAPHVEAPDLVGAALVDFLDRS